MITMENSISIAELRSLVEYDPLTGIMLWKRRSIDMSGVSSSGSCSRFNKLYAGKKVGSIGVEGYYLTKLFGRGYIVARLIYAYMTGKWPEQVDHINHDRADNRWVNLRGVTNRENQMNITLRKDNTSGQIGVHWFKQTNRWCVHISTKTNKRKNLGYFRSLEEAIAVRKEAEKKYGYHNNHGN